MATRPGVQSIEEQVANWTQAELLDLTARLIEIAKSKGKPRKKKHDLSKYVGTLKTEIDPLEFQRQIRAEWD